MAEQVSTTAALVEEEDSAEILQDNLTQGANLGAGFAKWSPDTGETVHDRLAAIVGGAMGYEPEDLPWEVPLIELGLDSLMAVRIKNRVEYDFDLPPIQLTAVRDANLYAVEKLIEYAIEHRDEVEQLHEHQQTLTPEEIAAEQAAMMAGTAPTGETPLAPEPPAAPPSDISIPPPPTDPTGPKSMLRPMPLRSPRRARPPWPRWAPSLRGECSANRQSPKRWVPTCPHVKPPNA